MLSPDSRANLARCQAEAPLIALSRFPKPSLGLAKKLGEKVWRIYAHDRALATLLSHVCK
jgi:hypothetical protein